MSIWQAYIDESYDGDGLIVLGGFVAPAEKWAAFSREWEEMLPFASLNAGGRYTLKMGEMAKTPERMERAQAFWRIIEKHVSFGLICAIKKTDLLAACSRITLVEGSSDPVSADTSRYENEYIFAFWLLLVGFHEQRSTGKFRILIEDDQKIDFIFDDRSEKGSIIQAWDYFCDINRNVSLYGATPRFEDDEDFLPLQSADMFCWFARDWFKSGKSSSLVPWVNHRTDFTIVAGDFDEDQIFECIAFDIWRNLGPGVRIYDTKRQAFVGYRPVS